ncbi:hypothetical protein [Bacteroides sp. 51]|uniref:hypothetical protein n=1 Tax=Bacteroides sp. 51 TaxID=2302938 RepID=UPI0013D72AFD|nr:hypothetical protein [Bacteroides sp. 51]NDV81635.1 hypothetical protein [Bacteroides sp. 51]
MKDIIEEYKKLNSSFRKTLIFHLGVDSGFFAEYTYMVNAMLYCLQHKIQFKIYSADANFGYDKGWTDYFIPFCEEVTEEFHRKHNIHTVPKWNKILSSSLKQKSIRLIKWKLKTILINFRASILALQTYKKRVLLNHSVHFNHNQHFRIPELGIDGDYIHAFGIMVDITFRFNKETTDECNKLISGLQLPPHYIGCQVRGGDKVTETELLPPEHYIHILSNQAKNKPVFVLTDDYAIFARLQQLSPNTHWLTLCTPEEKGYVNSAFTQTGYIQKRNKMTRFLASMKVLLASDYFIGSITTGPSLFLLKKLYPNALPADCEPEDLQKVAALPITERGEIMQKYLNSHLLS